MERWLRSKDYSFNHSNTRISLALKIPYRQLRHRFLGYYNRGLESLDTIKYENYACTFRDWNIQTWNVQFQIRQLYVLYTTASVFDVYRSKSYSIQ